MKAWRLERLGGALTFEEVPVPEPRPQSVLVRIETVPLLSYLKRYVEGKLGFYGPPGPARDQVTAESEAEAMALIECAAAMALVEGHWPAIERVAAALAGSAQLSEAQGRPDRGERWNWSLSWNKRQWVNAFRLPD